LFDVGQVVGISFFFKHKCWYQIYWSF
jgi:hypothetical protein